MPFPTRQGTQAAVDAMVRADAGAADSAAALLTYGERGFGAVTAVRDPSRRARVTADRPFSLRPFRREAPRAWTRSCSPSCVPPVSRRASRRGGCTLVWRPPGLAAVARACPWIFVAHTILLRTSCPGYFPRRVDRWASPLRRRALWMRTLVRRSGAAPRLLRLTCADALECGAARGSLSARPAAGQSRVTAGERTASERVLDSRRLLARSSTSATWTATRVGT